MAFETRLFLKPEAGPSRGDGTEIRVGPTPLAFNPLSLVAAQAARSETVASVVSPILTAWVTTLWKLTLRLDKRVAVPIKRLFNAAAV
jgi:hypothetical protein